MAAQRPLQEHVKFLAERGITPPPTRRACELLKNYVERGNNTQGRTPEERVRIVLKYEAWLGRKVRSVDGGAEGIVSHLVAPPAGRIGGDRDAIDIHEGLKPGRGPRYPLHPFRLSVKGIHGGQPQYISRLTRVE